VGWMNLVQEFVLDDISRDSASAGIASGQLSRRAAHAGAEKNNEDT
jgi:hypothetical protein